MTAKAMIAWRLILSEISRPLPLVSGIVVVFVQAMTVAFTAPGRMSSGLGDPLNFALTSLAFAAPLTLAASGMTAVQHERSGLRDLAAAGPRSRLAVLGLSTAGPLVWGVASLLTASTVLVVMNGLFEPAGWGYLSLLLQGLALVLLSWALGVVVGAVFCNYGVSIAVTILWFLVIYGVGLARDPLASLIYPSIFFSFYVEPNAFLILAKSLMVVAVAGMLVSLLCGFRRAILGVTAFGLIVAMSVVLIGKATPSVALGRELKGAPACAASDGVSLCVWPEHASWLQTALPPLIAVRNRAAPYWTPPTQFFERGVALAGDTGSAREWNPSAGLDKLALIDAAANAVAPPLCDDGVAQDESWDIYDWLRFTESDGAAAVSGPVRSTADLSAEELRSWVDRRYVAATAC